DCRSQRRSAVGEAWTVAPRSLSGNSGVDSLQRSRFVGADRRRQDLELLCLAVSSRDADQRLWSNGGSRSTRVRSSQRSRRSRESRQRGRSDVDGLFAQRGNPVYCVSTRSCRLGYGSAHSHRISVEADRQVDCFKLFLIALCGQSVAITHRRFLAPAAAIGCLAAYSAILLFTSFRTSAVGKGRSVEKRIVPLLVE